MKNDLISRKALLERINYYITHTSVDSPENYAYSLIFEEVSKAPTAYDNEKVCEKLEHCMKTVKRQRDAAFERGDKENFKYWDGETGAYKGALEIVKKGGANDAT